MSVKRQKIENWIPEGVSGWKYDQSRRIKTMSHKLKEVPIKSESVIYNKKNETYYIP